MSGIVKVASEYLKTFSGGSEGKDSAIIGNEKFHPTIDNGMNLAGKLPLAPYAQQVGELYRSAGSLDAQNFLATQANRGLQKVANATKGLMRQGEQRAKLLSDLGIAALNHSSNMNATTQYTQGYQEGFSWDSTFKASSEELKNDGW